MDVSVEVVDEKPVRLEIFNFKEENACNMFKALTTETKEFTECFSNNFSLKVQIENWEEVLNSFCMKSFKKICIRKKKSKPVKLSTKKLIKERNKLRNRKKIA